MDIQKYLQHDLPDLKNLPRLAWFDNSTIEAFQDCNREAWYNHMLGLEDKSPAMAGGSIMHAGLEVYHQTKDISKANLALARAYEDLKDTMALASNRLSFGNLNDALRHYVTKWSNDQVTYHEQEVKFAVWMKGNKDPFGNEMIHLCEPGNCCMKPDFPGACFWYVGRFDGIITYMGQLLLLENKTTGQLGASYQNGLNMSRQARAYTTCIRRILKANNYPGPLPRGVYFNTIRLGSTIDFHRFQVDVPEKMSLEWEEETYEIVAQIRQSWSSQKKPVKNTRSCTRYGTCKFLDLCQAWTGRPKDEKPGVFGNFKEARWTPF